MPEGTPTDENCPFCKIFAGKVPATIAYAFEKQSFLVIVPLDPVVDGHLLVIPKEHVPDFMTDPVLSGEAMACASIYARRLGGEWNVLTSAGRAATQTVKHLHLHLHLHLVPRFDGDGLKLPWTDQHIKES